MTKEGEATGDPFVSVQEQDKLPYRWGYFQGVMLIPWSLFVLLSVASNATKYSHDPWYSRDPWYLTAVGFLMGLLGLPLAI